jgi:hypothetical protein
MSKDNNENSTQQSCPPDLFKEPLLITEKKPLSTGLEDALRAVRSVRQGKAMASRQWSLLVWLLSDDSREISDDASPLLRQLVIMARSKNYQEITEMLIFAKESARKEHKES